MSPATRLYAAAVLTVSVAALVIQSVTDDPGLDRLTGTAALVVTVAPMFVFGVHAVGSTLWARYLEGTAPRSRNRRCRTAPFVGTTVGGRETR